MTYPTCYSSSPITSLYSFKNSEDMLKMVLDVVGHKINPYLEFENELRFTREGASAYVPEINYSGYWLDGDDIGVALHPYTFLAVWFNKEGMAFCRNVNGADDLKTIIERIIGMRYEQIQDEIIEKYLSFMILLEELDLVVIKGMTHEK